MNDPGLEEPIEHAAQRVEDQQFVSDKNNTDHVGNEAAEFLDPSRWWFTSTAIPLIAGCFGPIASGFNLTALASHWRVTLPDGMADNVSDIIDLPDPKWLLALNGISLALAIVANLALLMNMAKRIPFKVAQPITIIGWYLSSFILVALVVAANVAPDMQLAVGVNLTLTQAYYYAIWAAFLYFALSSMMCVTVWGALAGKYEMNFQLTISQRTLMLQTTSYVVYLLAGAAVWHDLEGWSFSDSVYWANLTTLTIGLGDLTPSTQAGQGMIFPYAIGGIIILGLVIGSIRTLILERGKEKLSARMAERMREKAVRQLLKHGGGVKLGPIRKWYWLDTQVPHVEKRKQEFDIMRRIQYQADIRRKWTALLTSSVAGIIIWFVGAAVFHKTEESQGWTYFNSLYFCYICLLTVGYGDFKPLTNSGKSFFVFWTLLAVPTLTILISNMGDTVVRLIKDLTLWLGELTILPGNQGIRGRFKAFLYSLTRHSRFAGNEAPGAIANEAHEEAENYSAGRPLRESSSGDSDDIEKGPGKRHNKADPGMLETERRGKLVEHDEFEEAKLARARGDFKNEDKHMYRFLLIREIRHVMRDIGTQPPKRYTYSEWAWILKLLGEAEDDESHHRHPMAPVDVRKNAEGRQYVGRSGEDVKWSWIGERSPLMGDTNEPEWILERLTVRLEEELRDISREERKTRRKSTGSDEG